jgi:peptidyl-tRNA hydrolase, PTH1 family
VFFKSKKTVQPQNFDWLVCGLGNPGKIYSGNRHNIGWMVLTALCEKYKKKFKALENVCYHAVLNIDSYTILTILPTTFMNNSGEAIYTISNKYSIPITQIIVVCDEYNFPLGKIHLRQGGNDGGHNGIKSIIETLDSNEFFRLRCGIGKNFPQGGMIEYVLSDFKKEEMPERDIMLTHAVDSIVHLIRVGKTRAMTEINSEIFWKKEEIE